MHVYDKPLESRSTRLFTANLLEGRPIPPYGDGLNERDWLYVDDHCAGVHLVLTDGKPGEIYNIGASNETPNRVLADKLLALTGCDQSLVTYVEDRLGHDRPAPVPGIGSGNHQIGLWRG